MFLVCEENPKFEETGKLIQAAKDLGIEVYDRPVMFDNFFCYGTRPFVLPLVDDSYHIFSKQEYIYDYSFLLSTSLTFNHILNYYCDIVPAKRIREVINRKKTKTIFARPNSGNKQFNGDVFPKAAFQANTPQFLQINPWELVVLAEDRGKPTKEYRFFVIRNADDEIKYECCEYLPEHSNEVPDNVKEFADSVIEIIFDSIPFGNSFVLDICELDGCLWVLELNSANSSSYYSISPNSLLEMIFS